VFATRRSIEQSARIEAVGVPEVVAWTGTFEWRGLSGGVDVECIANDDPDGYGTVASDAFGFPVCTATVRYPRRGYNAMFGWVQLVRSTDNQSAGQHFEMDPFALFGDVRSPYCWYGTEPTLFDAPSRHDRAPIEWVAYSFLATTPIDEIMQGNLRRVVPLLGFEWGFEIRPEIAPSIELRRVTSIGSNEWAAQLPVLRVEYPSPLWTFADTMQGSRA
jgi:hypothetical protein